MSIAVATTPHDPAVEPIVTPDVLLDGRPTDELFAHRLSSTGPLDQRSARLLLTRYPNEAVIDLHRRAARLVGRRIALLWPTDLGDRDGAYLPLFAGRTIGIERGLSADRDALTVRADCDWSFALEQPMRGAVDPGAMREVVEAIAAAIGWSIDLAGLPADMTGLRVDGIGPGQPPAATLRSMCRSLGLFVQRRMVWHGGQISERPALVAAAHGRPIRLPSSPSPRSSMIAAIDAAPDSPLPLLCRAEAPGRVVESTFALMPAWNAGATALPDAQFAKSTSDDFEAVREVFRMWLLNEDASLAGEPFDLTALFDAEAPIPRTPLRFGDPLTRDGAGNRLGPLIEYSIGGGSAWQVYPEAVRVLDERAGVYLDGDALPAGFIDAARSGQALMRITATLQDPRPLVAERRIGNPFVGPFETLTLKVGNRFACRSVDPNSRYAEAVASGEREADVTDDRTALAAWLVRRSEQRSLGELIARLRTTAVQPTLGIGDRLNGIGGIASDAAAAIDRIDHRFDEAHTRVDLVATGAPA